MWTDFFSFLGPLVLGVVITTVIEAVTGKTWGLVVRRRFEQRARGRLTALGSAGDLIRRGDEALYVLEFVPNGWRPENISLRELPTNVTATALRSADPDALPLPADALLQAISAERARLEDSESVDWNGQSLAVSSIGLSRTGDGTEAPMLRLTVSPSDHASATVCSDLWMERFDSGLLTLPDYPDKPIPGMIHAIGLNATLVTDDGYLILVRRSEHTSSGRGGWHISVNEGMLPQDRDLDNRLDPHVGMVRGVHEELGVRITPDLIHFHTAMFDVRRYQFGLLGHIDLRGTGIEASHIVAARQTGMAPDKFENRALTTIPWKYENVLQYLRTPDWVEHGWLNLLQSAIESFPSKKEELARLRGEFRSSTNVKS